MAHTPGPWEAYCVTSAGWSVRTSQPLPGYSDKSPVCSMAWWQFDIPGVIDDEISEANARLIAAAPDLLAACKEAKLFIDQKYDTVHDFIDKAINLAEGKAS